MRVAFNKIPTRWRRIEPKANQFHDWHHSAVFYLKGLILSFQLCKYELPSLKIQNQTKCSFILLGSIGACT